ncbi:MAG: imidazolonepropionase-like amidohydrolase [Planctomycetota bacterium]|jgi:imidazolonepropionase-like amidohydrolase
MNLKSNSHGWLHGFAIVAALCMGMAIEAHAQVRMVFQETVALKVGHLVTGDGPTMNDVVVLIRGTKIVAIGKNLKVPNRARWVDLSDSWVFPGLVDCHSKAGMPNDLKEPRDAVDLDNKPTAALIPGHRDFRLLREAGVTTAVILPSPEGVVSGIAAVVKTSGKRRLVTEQGPVALALTASTQKSERFPTSLMGSFQLLGQKLAKPDDKILEAVAANKRAAIVKLDTEAEIRSYLRLANALSLNCAMATDSSIRRVMGQLKRPMFIALPAIGLNSPRRDLMLPAALAKKNHKVAFYASTPDRSASDLRYAAALSVKMGMTKADGLSTITKNAAEIAGVGDRIGTLKTGKDADFIVLSGHLLDLSATLKQTWIDGRIVFERPSKKVEMSR